MRKILIAMLLPVFLVSCNEMSQTTQSEITLAPQISCMETRGYVEGTTMDDSDGGATRVIYLSAYDKTNTRDYFVGCTFKKDATDWRSYEESMLAPKYWPIDHTLNFLAYSVASSAPTAVWNTQGATTGLDLYVGRESLQDDILIAAAAERKNSADPMCMTFSHTQAWVEYEIQAVDMPEVTIADVTIKSVYSTGQFSVENYDATLIGKWDFSGATAADCKVVPAGSSTIAASSAEKVKVSALMPAQSAQEAVISYKAGGIYKTTTIGMKVPVWEMGTHYIYKVTISPLLTRAGENVATGENVEVELLQKPW
mgnify:CR=1 FL=1